MKDTQDMDTQDPQELQEMQDTFPTDAASSPEPPLIEVSDAPQSTPKKGTRRSSTTLRLLLAVLLLAVAAFVWLNYFDLAVPPDERAGSASPAASSPAQRTDGDDILAEASPPGSGLGDPAEPGLAETGGDPAALTGSAAVTTPGLARPLVISELPFLITEAQAPAEPGVLDLSGPAELARPELQRLTVNPFSPVVLRETAAEPAAEASQLARQPAAPGSETDVAEAVIEVPIPPTPTAVLAEAPAVPAPVPATEPPPVRAPAPAPGTVNAAAQVSTPDAAPPAPADGAPLPTGLAPASAAQTAGRNLPRPLPTGTLSPAPRLLLERRVVTEIPVPSLAQLTAEQGAPGQAAELAESAAPAAGTPDPVMIEPVAAETEEPGHQPRPLPVTALASHGQPLAAGITPLSRYLRDENVTFTGSVLGPVSVGMFRTSQSEAAFVVSLGQALPDTSIILTDLRGQQAELTLGDASQILTMELRR